MDITIQKNKKNLYERWEILGLLYAAYMLVKVCGDCKGCGCRNTYY